MLHGTFELYVFMLWCGLVSTIQTTFSLVHRSVYLGFRKTPTGRRFWHTFWLLISISEYIHLLLLKYLPFVIKAFLDTYDINLYQRNLYQYLFLLIREIPLPVGGFGSKHLFLIFSVIYPTHISDYIPFHLVLVTAIYDQLVGPAIYSLKKNYPSFFDISLQFCD